MPVRVSTSLVLLAIALYSAIAIGDLRWRKIPNLLVFAVLLLGIAKALFAGSYLDLFLSVGVAAFAFVIVFPLFVLGAMGGGDAKLIPASIVLVGYQDAIGFVFGMSILGGLLSLIIIVREFFKKRRSGLTASGGGPRTRVATVPYGVAIAGAAVLALLQLPQG